jgi:ribosomal-protein-serine acetyltransferase
VRRTETRTARLLVVPVESGQARAIYQAIVASFDELAAWFHWATPEYTFAHAAEYAQRAELDWRKRDAFHFTAWDHDARRCLATVSLTVTNRAERRAEIGYWVRTDATARGVCREACRPVLDFGFGPASLHRVTLRAAVDNEPSNRVAKALGFTFEGVARQEGTAQGRWLDMNRWSILDQEWTEVPKPPPDDRPLE